MKKLTFILLFVFCCSFSLSAQEPAPWNLSQTSNDFNYFVTWVRSNFAGLENNKINLVNIPMGKSNKPAMVLKLPKDTYNAYSQFGNIKSIGWNYYEHANYVLFAMEVYIAVPSGTFCFRQFFDPADVATLDIVNFWVSLEGDAVIFFIGDENLNYISGSIPNKAIATEVLSKAKVKLASIANKGTFDAALCGIPNTVSYYEKM